MANILKRREASSQQSFNGFDLSHKVYFTGTTGMIYPVHYDRLQPSDKIRISTDVFSRLQPSNSASPVQLTEHVDYFFVPYRLMFSLMPSMLADVNDWHSTLMKVDETYSYGAEDYPHCQLDYVLQNSSLDSSGLIPYDSSDLQDASLCLGNRIMLQLLGYGDFNRSYLLSIYNQWQKPDPDSDPEPVFSVVSRRYDVFPLLAYQCIWQWFYRLDTRENVDRSLYNVDEWYNQVPDSNGILPYSKEFSFYDNNILNIRYRPWKRDFFTSNEISPLGSDISFSHYRGRTNSPQFGSFVRQWLDDIDSNNYYVTAEDGERPVYQSGSSQNGTQVAWEIPERMIGDTREYYQTTQQHRIAAVIEKLSAIWQQTGKTYKDQMEKQFGIKLGDHLSSRPIYIGSQSTSFDMKPVVADVETSQMAAGTITGYGVANSDEKQNPIEFTAPEHGIFLALFSVVPEACYRPIGLDFANTYQTRGDFPLPVTDELGQRPLFAFEVYNRCDATKDNARLGWLSRHQELKLKKDMRYTGFDTTLGYWIPVRSDAAYANDLASYYVSPSYLNPMMLVEYMDYDALSQSGGPNWYDDAAFDGDPFMHFLSVHCFKSSKQSTYGVPQNFFG